MLRNILTDARQQVLEQVEAAVDVTDGIDRLPGRDGSRPRRGRKTEQTSQHVKRLPPRSRGSNSLHPRHNTLELGDAALVLGRCAARTGGLFLQPLAPTTRAPAATAGAAAPLVGIGAIVGVVARVVIAIVAVLVERVLGEI